MPKKHKSSNPLQSTARRLTIASIIISPWLIGSSDGWAYLLVCMLIGIATIIWLFSLLSQKSIKLTAPKTLLLMMLFAIFAACQTIPLPSKLIKAISPAAALTTQKQAVEKYFTNTTPTIPKPTIKSALSWASSDGGSGRANSSPHIHHPSFITHHSPPYPFSVSPESTNRAILLIIAFISIFAILSNTITTWSELRGSVITIITSGSIMAFLGTIHEYSDSKEILWFHIPRYGGSIFGPFTNTNHFAVHINMVFALALGLFMSNRYARKQHKQAQGNLYIDYSRIGRMALLLLAMTIMGGAACFSLSRGGIVALLGSIGIVLFLTSISDRKNQKNQSQSLLKASIFLIVAGTIWFGWEPVVNELGTLSAYANDPLQDGRFTVFKDTLRIFKNYPLFGSGFGTFRHIFPSFQSLVGYNHYTHAHNDISQLLAESGIIGTGLFLMIVCFWGKYIKSNFQKAKPEARSFVIGTLIGIMSAAIYSNWEYGLHKPANGFLLMGLAGMAIAAISMRETKHPITPTPAGPGTRSGIVSLILLISWMIGSMVLQFQGELAYTRFIYYQRLANKASTPDAYSRMVLSACEEAELMHAIPIDNPTAMREVSEALLDWSRNSKLKTDARIYTTEQALATANYAVEISPSDYHAWLALARTHALLGSWETAEIYLNQARTLAAPGMPVRMFVRK